MTVALTNRYQITRTETINISHRETRALAIQFLYATLGGDFIDDGGFIVVNNEAGLEERRRSAREWDYHVYETIKYLEELNEAETQFNKAVAASVKFEPK